MSVLALRTIICSAKFSIWGNFAGLDDSCTDAAHKFCKTVTPVSAFARGGFSRNAICLRQKMIRDSILNRVEADMPGEIPSACIEKIEHWFRKVAAEPLTALPEIRITCEDDFQKHCHGTDSLRQKFECGLKLFNARSATFHKTQKSSTDIVLHRRCQRTLFRYQVLENKNEELNRRTAEACDSALAQYCQSRAGFTAWPLKKECLRKHKDELSI